MALSSPPSAPSLPVRLAANVVWPWRGAAGDVASDRAGAAAPRARPWRRAMARDGLVAVALAGLAAWAGAPAALPTLIAGAGVGQVVIAATGWGAGRAAWLRVVAGGTMLARAAVLAPLYLAVMTPLGLGRRALGADPLDIRRTSRTTGWHERGQDSNDPVLFERLY